MRKLFIIVVGVVVFAAAFAQTSSQPNTMRSIVIKSGAQPLEEPLSGGEGPQPPLSADKRAYWECVLEHVQGQENNAALNIILAACRALTGGG